MYSGRVKVPARDGYVSLTFTNDQSRWLEKQHGANHFGVRLLITSWVTLLADTPLESKKPKKIFGKFFGRLTSDLFGQIKLLSSLGDELASSLIHTDEGVSITHFIPEFRDTPIFFEYLRFTKTLDAELLRFILSVCHFGKKLFYENPDLDVIAFRKWLQVEEKLEALVLDMDLCMALRHIIKSFFKLDDVRTAPFLPSHGSGRVAEQGIWGSNQKNQHFSVPLKLSYLLDKTFPDWRTRVLPDASRSSTISKVGLDHSRLRFVPKNWKTTRSICMEPIVYQWSQQATRLWYEHLMRDSYLHRYVTIEDQTNNQNGSEFGSDFGLVDTIDLSAASDSVSWDLVKKIFPPTILKWLAATRTTKVLSPKGEIIKVKKFAPMGSALCFPVQSTIYSSIVILAMILRSDPTRQLQYSDVLNLDIQKELQRTSTKDFSFTKYKLQPFRVYGDDIICDTRITSDVIRMLQELGFSVNTEKSFTGNQAYRESCGTHHFDGSDVTPYTYKVKSVGPKMPISTTSGLIDHCNRALDYGYLNLRRHLKNIVIYYPILDVRRDKKGRNPVLFSNNTDDSMAIMSANPRNNHLDKRYYYHGNHDPTSVESYIRFQRDEVRSLGVTAKKRVDYDTDFDQYHYVVWQRSRAYAEENTLDISVPHKFDAMGIRVVRRWTPN